MRSFLLKNIAGRGAHQESSFRSETADQFESVGAAEGSGSVYQSTATEAGNPNSVANGITVMMEMFTGLAFILLLALSMAMFGCGNEETQSITKPVSMNTDVATPQPIVETPIVEEPEFVVTEPIIVSFADAESVYNERNYDEAKTLFATYSEQNPDNAWGHYMFGLSSKRAGDVKQAEIALSRAIELDPKHVKSLLNLSRVLIDDMRPQEALDALDRALELDNESNDAYRLQGRAFHNLGWLDDATHAYREAILIDSTDAWSMNNLALVQLEQEQYDDALHALARTIELRDDVAIFFNNLGMALEHTGHIRDAATAYTSAVELDVAYDKASNNLARVEAIEQDSSVLGVDLEQLAGVFIEEIKSWNVEALAAENASMTELDEAVNNISESDSTVVIEFEF